LSYLVFWRDLSSLALLSAKGHCRVLEAHASVLCLKAVKDASASEGLFFVFVVVVVVVVVIVVVVVFALSDGFYF
jgi:hypothetical protein